MHKFKVPLFTSDIILLTEADADIAATELYLSKEYFDDEGNGGWASPTRTGAAIHMYNSPLFDEDESVLVSFIAHECLHAAFMVFERAGEKRKHIGEESLCYMLTAIMAEAYTYYMGVRKQKLSEESYEDVAGHEGLEPPLTVLETDVLPITPTTQEDTTVQ